VLKKVQQNNFFWHDHDEFEKFCRRSCKQQKPLKICETKIENHQQFTMARQRNNFFLNTKHKKTSMKLHGAYGVHKENGSCKSEIMLTKRRKKSKSRVNCKK
jgi:hypothetical protein